MTRSFPDDDGVRWTVEDAEAPSWRHAPAPDRAAAFVLVSADAVRVPVRGTQMLGALTDEDLRAILRSWAASRSD